MKILLDECVTKKVKQLLTEYEVSTVSELNYNGLKDGALLAEAEKAGFDILLTIDKNIDHQQNIAKFHLAIVILDVLKSTLPHIEKLLPEFKKQINSFEKGRAYRLKTA